MYNLLLSLLREYSHNDNYQNMEQQEVHRKLDLILAKTQVLESKVNDNALTLSEKINPSKKEWLNDDDIEKEYGITKNVRYKLIKSGKLLRYKFEGKKSKSLYKRKEIEASLESGLIFPQPKRV